MRGGEADAFMFINVEMCTLQWSNQRRARHNATTKNHRTSLRQQKQGSSGSRGKDRKMWAGHGETILLDLVRRRTLTRETSHTSHAWYPPAQSHNTLHNVLVLISIQTSSLIPIMTFSSSVIDLWLKHRPELEHSYSQPEENATH